MKKLIFLFLISTLFAKEIIYICDDGAEWPPFVFYERNNGKINKSKIVGALVDLYDVIFKDLNLSYKLELIPWKRCTYLVEHYDKAKKYVIFPGIYSQRRAKVLYYTKNPIYTTHQVIWYSTKKFNEKEIKEKIKNNINSLKICDVNGYNIEFYYKILGVNKNKKINQEATSQCAVLKKISANRCDIMVGSKESILGAKMIGKCNIPKDISYIPDERLKESNFILFVSKKGYPKGKELVKKLDKELKKLDKNGTKKEILKRWIKE